MGSGKARGVELDENGEKATKGERLGKHWYDPTRCTEMPKEQWKDEAYQQVETRRERAE